MGLPKMGFARAGLNYLSPFLHYIFFWKVLQPLKQMLYSWKPK